MADTPDGDILMYLIQKEGAQPLAAESVSALTGSGERMMQGFVAGRYFEIENFGFSLELTDDEGGTGTQGADSGTYGRWRSLKDTEPKPNPPFKAEPQDATFSRQIDSASPELLSCCLNTRRFHRAVLVKRSRIGTTGKLSGILRMEFEDVWLKSIGWDDGDAVRETCKFKFAAVKVTYVSRKPDGSVAALWPCEWRGLRNG